MSKIEEASKKGREMIQKVIRKKKEASNSSRRRVKEKRKRVE
jgi:hypothetical protein